MKNIDYSEFINVYAEKQVNSSLVSIKITFNKEGKKEVNFLEQIKEEMLEKNDIIKGIKPVSYEGYEVDFREGYNSEVYKLIRELHKKIAKTNIILDILIHSQYDSFTPDA